METHEYVFDVTLASVIRINAPSIGEARLMVDEFLDCASVNLGEMGGEPVITEASIISEPVLVAIDGEPIGE